MHKFVNIISETKETEAILGVSNSSDVGRHNWMRLSISMARRATWHRNRKFNT